MVAIDQFFRPLDPFENFEESDYQLLENYLKSLESITRMIDLSYYIIDYSKQGFVYVSNHPLFLAGYGREQVEKWGYDFFAKVVPEEDLLMLLEINEKGFEFYYRLPKERRLKGYISYDFRIKNQNGGSILINHKLTPLLLNKEGNLWISLCLVTLSTAKKSGNLQIQMQDEGVRYNYNFKTRKFSEASSKSLTEIEKKIVQLLSLGNSVNEISTLTKCSANTVKFHKKNIFRKLEVKTSNEAVYFATMQKSGE